MENTRQDSLPRGKPAWLRVAAFSGRNFAYVTNVVDRLQLHTVCREANCPNRGECFNRGTVTFLLLGPICTRGCRFCDVLRGRPRPPDLTEPQRVALAAQQLGLRHVVVTSVTRDDLADGGAIQFAETVRHLRRVLPEAAIEVLTPDFGGMPAAWQIVRASQPDVFNHNVETVPSRYVQVRPGADYPRSLRLLGWMRDHSDSVIKSGLMVGLGESAEELRRVFGDLAAHGVSILTIGQYLAPSIRHLPVRRYWHPDEFAQLAEWAREAGLRTVVAGPLVRSSYQADAVFRRR